MANRGLKIVVLFFATSVLIFSFIPPEQQLGGWIRLVILHGMLSMVGLATIFAAGILGVAYLLTKQKNIGLWSREIGLNSVLFWFIGTALSLVSMQVAWGGLLWNEPYTVAALTMVVLGAGKEYLVRSGGGKLQSFALANIGYAAAVLVIRQRMVSVMHPENPIGTSESLAIRFLPFLFLGLTVLVMVELTRWRLKQGVNQSSN